jgi:hypothetical protein
VALLDKAISLNQLNPDLFGLHGIAKIYSGTPKLAPDDLANAIKLET